MKRVDLAGLAMETSEGIPVVVLREHDEPHRLLPIFIGGLELTAIAVAASGEETSRPMTHDLMASLVVALGGELLAVEVTGLSDGAFIAGLVVVAPDGEHRIDARPSDAIALAMRFDAEVLVSEDVLDEAGSLPVPEAENLEADDLNAEAIDQEVEEFRSFLDDVEPDHFFDS